MTRKFLGLCAILVLFNTLPALAETNNFSPRKTKPVPIASPAKTFTLGESLTFDVFWFGIHIGTGTLEIPEITKINGRDAYHVVAIAKTNEFLTKLYPVQDEIHSFIDAENFHSLEFRKKISEGRYRAEERIVYDVAKKKAFYESLKNGSKKEFPLESPGHDLVSAFYWFRLQEAIVGKSVRTVINGEEKTWDLRIDVLRQEVKELRGGESIDTIVVEPKTLYRGVLYDRGRAWVYFSSDSARTPIWITLKTPYGPVMGVLRKSKKTN